MGPWERPVARATFMCVLALLASLAMGKPCPDNALFVYSAHHKADHCVCLKEQPCAGSGCTRGSDADNLPSYSAAHTGFPVLCADCRCGNTTASAAPLPPSADGHFGHIDKLFQERCLVDHTVVPHKPRALAAMNWIHIPKCGTSVTTIVYNYACQELPGAKLPQIVFGEGYETSPEALEYQHATCDFCWKMCTQVPNCSAFTNWAPHTGLFREKGAPFDQKHCAAKILGNIPGHTPLNYTQELRGTYVSMFRDPRKRLLSAFNYGRHAVGLPVETRRLHIKNLKALKTLEEFALYPGIANCQTKMVLGFACSAEVPVSSINIAEARRRLNDDFAFVGIVDYWEASVCLFHRMFGAPIHEHEFLNLRPTATYMDDLEKQGYTFLPSDAWKSIPLTLESNDWFLYVAARRIFVHRLKIYGIQVPPALLQELGEELKKPS